MRAAAACCLLPAAAPSLSAPPAPIRLLSVPFAFRCLGLCLSASPSIHPLASSSEMNYDEDDELDFYDYMERRREQQEQRERALQPKQRKK